MQWALLILSITILVTAFILLQSVAHVQEQLKSLESLLSDMRQERSGKLSLRDMAEAKMRAYRNGQGRPTTLPNLTGG